MTTDLCPTQAALDDEDFHLDFDSPPDPRISDCVSIHYHLHLADELVDWVQRALDENDVAGSTGATFRMPEEHAQILEGTHPHQAQHIPKPENWRPEQAERLQKLKKFIDETRPRPANVLS